MQPTLGAQIPGCRRWMGVPPLFDPVPPPALPSSPIQCSPSLATESILGAPITPPFPHPSRPPYQNKKKSPFTPHPILLHPHRPGGG